MATMLNFLKSPIFKSKVVWVAALGYFVDLYDLVLFGVVRVQSLKSLNLSQEEVFTVGSRLLNLQMVGMLVGGLVWGIIADKKGRRFALYGSIFVYSLANLLNAFVVNVPQYEVLRFISGFGLAGELGAAITLVSEALPSKQRGWGATLVAVVGFFGAVTATIVSQYLSWQHLYLSGGILGFLLLFIRLSVAESALFSKARIEVSKKNLGSLWMLVSSGKRMRLFTMAVLAGVPIWFVAGVLAYFSPELARALDIQGEVLTGPNIMMGYMGSIIGDVCCGWLSQHWQSRKKAVIVFLAFGAFAALAHPLWVRGGSPEWFYINRGIIGFANGYVAVLIMWIAELFGTNLRGTVTTWVPNLYRASVVPLLFAWGYLKPHWDWVGSCTIIGSVVFATAMICTFLLPETFHRDLNFNEVH